MHTMLQRGVSALMIVMTAWMMPISGAAAGSDVARTVQGEVVTVNLQSTPNVIVIKVLLPSKQEMIVGATVGAGVSITRGKEAIGLDGITAGQTVNLTYVKSENGLDARSIQVRK